jgi:hypothetical protein
MFNPAHLVVVMDSEGVKGMNFAQSEPRFASLFALLLAGCGAPAVSAGVDASSPWVGTWTGSTTTTGSCDDGSAVPTETAPISLTLAANGTTLTWMASCGATALAAVSGNAAVISQYSCPARRVNGNTLSFTATGGTLVLNGSALQLSLQARVVVSGALSGRCTTSSTGTLTRTSP